MTIRIVRVSRGGSDAPQAALALAAYALAYLAWTDFGRLYSSLRGPQEWVLAALFGAAAAAPGILWVSARTNLAVAALAVGFVSVPALLGGRLHLPSVGMTVLFGAGALAVDRLRSPVRVIALGMGAAALAAVVSWSRPLSGFGSVLLGTAAALPAVGILIRGERGSASTLLFAKVAAVLLAEELLRSTILPWNGFRGPVFWILLAAGTTGAAALVSVLARATAGLDRFSCLAFATGALLVLAVGRRVHDPDSARNLLLMGTIAAEFVLFIFLGLGHLKRESERPAAVPAPRRCAVPLLDRRDDVAVELRLAKQEGD